MPKQGTKYIQNKERESCTCCIICWVGIAPGADDPHTGREVGTNSGCTVVIRGWGLLAGGGLVDIKWGCPRCGIPWGGGGTCACTMTCWGGPPARVEQTEKFQVRTCLNISLWSFPTKCDISTVTNIFFYLWINFL